VIFVRIFSFIIKRREWGH